MHREKAQEGGFLLFKKQVGAGRSLGAGISRLTSNLVCVRLQFKKRKEVRSEGKETVGGPGGWCSYRLVSEWGQDNNPLHGVHHHPPELLQDPLQNCLLTDFGKQGEAEGEGDDDITRSYLEPYVSLACVGPGFDS